MKYFVRKTFEDVKTQIGEYKQLNAAIKKAQQSDGYSVFNEDGDMYPVPIDETTKTAEEIFAPLNSIPDVDKIQEDEVNEEPKKDDVIEDTEDKEEESKDNEATTEDVVSETQDSKISSEEAFARFRLIKTRQLWR